MFRIVSFGLKFYLQKNDRINIGFNLLEFFCYMSYTRNDKLAKLQPIADQCNDERRKELESRISEVFSVSDFPLIFYEDVD